MTRGDVVARAGSGLSMERTVQPLYVIGVNHDTAILSPAASCS